MIVWARAVSVSMTIYVHFYTSTTYLNSTPSVSRFAPCYLHI